MNAPNCTLWNNVVYYKSASHLIELIHDLNNQTVSSTDVLMAKWL